MTTKFPLRALAVLLALAALPAFAGSSTPAAKTIPGSLSAKAAGTEVELFAGIKSGDIEVTIIPKDATEATILFKNKTGKAVAIMVPETFAAVQVNTKAGGLGAAIDPGAVRLPVAFSRNSVLAQFGGPVGGAGAGGGGGGRGGGGALGGMGGAGQGMMGGMGGGMGGMMGGMGGMMGGMGGGMGGFGGFMNVAPDKIAKLKVPLVCLEHGKKDPTPRMKYELRPIETFTDNANVVELGKMLSRGEVDQKSAQAATWHMLSGLSWQELAAKEKVHLSNGYVEMYFNENHVVFASRVVAEAVKRAKDQAKPQATTPVSQN